MLVKDAPCGLLRLSGGKTFQWVEYVFKIVEYGKCPKTEYRLYDSSTDCASYGNSASEVECEVIDVYKLLSPTGKPAIETKESSESLESVVANLELRLRDLEGSIGNLVSTVSQIAVSKAIRELATLSTESRTTGSVD